MLVLFQDKVLNIGYDFLHIFSLIGCAVDDQIDWAVNSSSAIGSAIKFLLHGKERSRR